MVDQVPGEPVIVVDVLAVVWIQRAVVKNAKQFLLCISDGKGTEESGESLQQVEVNNSLLVSSKRINLDLDWCDSHETAVAKEGKDPQALDSSQPVAEPAVSGVFAVAI